MKIEFAGQIFEKIQISILMKILPVAVELWTDGRTDEVREQTDITNITVTLSNSSNAPSKLQQSNQNF